MAVMTCRHYREFDSSHAPKKGDDMWCFRCRTWGKCESLNKEFKVWCRGCKWSRGFGRNRLQAEIKASKHHNRFPEHEVWLAEGSDVVHQWKPQPNALCGLSKISAKNRSSGVEQLDLPPF